MGNDTAPSGKKMCVACQTDIAGRRAVPVREDRIIRIIRTVKRALGIAQMNQLFVCEPCMAKHTERRRSFEKTLLFATVLAGIMLILLLLVPILSGRFDAWAFVSGIIVACIIVLVPIMFKYVPAVEGPVPAALFSTARTIAPAAPAPVAQEAPLAPPPSGARRKIRKK